MSVRGERGLEFAIRTQQYRERKQESKAKQSKAKPNKENMVLEEQASLRKSASVPEGRKEGWTDWMNV